MRGLNSPVARGSADLETSEGDRESSIDYTRFESTCVLLPALLHCVYTADSDVLSDVLATVLLTTDEKGKSSASVQMFCFFRQPA